MRESLTIHIQKDISTFDFSITYLDGSEADNGFGYPTKKAAKKAAEHAKYRLEKSMGRQQ